MKSISQIALLLLLLLNAWPSTTALTVQELAARPAVQRALTSRPQHAESVLSFFFAGVDYRDPGQVDTILRKGECLQTMQRMWWMGDPEYDKLCRCFSETVRQVGKNGDFGCKQDTLLSTIDIRMSHVILCDQLSRNCFRGEAEAFAYEDVAIRAARFIADAAIRSYESGAICQDGEIYPPYLSFCVTAMMHSESLLDHELAIQLIDLGKATVSSHLKSFFELQRGMQLEHMNVVKRFGRYPHRNSALGRQSTQEELMWLSDYDNIPAWAKTQMKSSE